MSSPERQELSRRDEQLLDGSAIHRLLDRPLTEDAIHDATLRVAQPRTLVEGQTRGFLQFRQGGESFLIPSLEIDCMTRLAVVRRIPHRTNRIVRGICHIDGDLILCGDLSELMQLGEAREPRDEDNAARMIVLGQQDRWAVQVDAVEGVAHLDIASSRQPPVTVRGIRQQFVTQLVPIGDDFASLLDSQSLIAAFQESLA